MPIPLIGIAASLAAEYLPAAIGWLAGDNAEKVAEKVVGMATDITGQAEPKDALAALRADPKLAAQYRQSLLDYQKTELQEDTKRLQAVNETIRAEVASTDEFVRRWRPTYGYCVAYSWFIQMTLLSVAITYTIISNPGGLSAIIAALSSIFTALAGLWAIALTVLGVSVSKRSQDKLVAAGQSPAPGILDGIAAKLMGKSNG